MMKLMLGWLLAIAIAVVVFGLAVDHPVANGIYLAAMTVFAAGATFGGVVMAWLMVRAALRGDLFRDTRSRMGRDVGFGKGGPAPVVRTDEEALQEFLDRSRY